MKSLISKRILLVLISCIAAIIVSAIVVTMGLRVSNVSSDISYSSDIQSEDIIVSDKTESTVVSSKEESVVSKPEETTPSTSESTVTSQLPTQTSSENKSSSNAHTITPSNPNTPKHPISGLPFKQAADTNTGISWDGVSPIVYTYPDGTTGTEKREGATYESVPGMIGTVYIQRDDAGREYNTICSECGRFVGGLAGCYYVSEKQYCLMCGEILMPNTCHFCEDSNISVSYCTDCGKIGGYGWGGTCIRYWTGGDHECVSCGEIIPVNTCHTCSKGCRYCGKTMGYGTNGTCYRDYFSYSKCPSCNVSVPINTCHTCGN